MRGRPVEPVHAAGRRPVREGQRVDDRRRPLARGSTGSSSVAARSTEIPAVTHVDYSARVQTVDVETPPRGSIEAALAFERARPAARVVINTSFNVRGEPIVCTPAEAYRCFMATDMDALVLDRHVLLKASQPNADRRRPCRALRRRPDRRDPDVADARAYELQLAASDRRPDGLETLLAVLRLRLRVERPRPLRGPHAGGAGGSLGRRADRRGHASDERDRCPGRSRSATRASAAR